MRWSRDSARVWSSSLAAGVVVAVGVSLTQTAAVATEPRPAGGVWASVSAGGEFSCGIRVDESLWCWGANGTGQLGLGDHQTRLVPTNVDDADWQAVATGDFGHSCGIRTDGTLWCWGWNAAGQLGTGDFGNRSTPTEIEGGGRWLSVVAGFDHTCAVRVDDTLWCWGDNSQGQLGIGSKAYDVPLPHRVDDADAGWSSVTAGDFHTCGIQLDATLWCWGDNGFGQLGLGDRKDRRVPTRVGVGSDWTDVSAGWGFACGVRATTHTLACWGSDDEGQLGLGDRRGRLHPVRIFGTFWADVSAGGDHACGLARDGSLLCWGHGRHGAVGYGGQADQLAPLRVGSRLDWASLSAGGAHSCAVLGTGQLACWGWGIDGQLGLGDTRRKLIPRIL